MMMTVKVRRQWVERNGSAMQFLEMIYPMGCWSQRVPVDAPFLSMLALLVEPAVFLKIVGSLRC